MLRSISGLSRDSFKVVSVGSNPTRSAQVFNIERLRVQSVMLLAILLLLALIFLGVSFFTSKFFLILVLVFLLFAYFSNRGTGP